MPRRRQTTRVRLWLPPLLYMALIFYVSSKPDPLPESFVVLRNPDIEDWMVDVIGGCLGAIAYSPVGSAFRWANPAKSRIPLVRRTKPAKAGSH
jgi:VanZ family protein